MTSVSQIVRGIIDDLSDGVSELVLIVVIMAEQNATIPAPLPEAANVVNQTANTLAKIARELAKTDYSDFQEIVDEINAAAGEVEFGTETMEKAMNKLKGGEGDRKQGWNGLVDACRVMSGNTIKLLQIVYGADLKRLQLTADELLESISGVCSPKNLKNRQDQQKFVNDMGAVTAKALKLADFIRDKAGDSESPYSQDLLRKMAEDLRQAAKEVVQAGNDALRDPATYAPIFDQKMKELMDKIRKGKQAVYEAETVPPALSKLEGIRPLLDKATNAVQELPKAINTPKYQKQEKDTKDAVQDVTRELRKNPRKVKEADRIDRSLADQIRAARDALKNANQPGGEKTKELNEATKALVDALENLKRKAGNGRPSDDDLAEFNKALGDLKKMGNFGANKPEDKEQMAYEQLKDSLGNLKKSAKEGDKDKVPQNIRQTVQNAKDLAKQLRDANPKGPGYERKQKAAQDLDAALPRLIKKSKDALGNNFDDDKLNDMLDAIRRLQRANRNDPNADRDMADFWKNIMDGLRKVQNDADKGDKDGVDDGLQAIRDALAGLRKNADRLAENHPNRRQIDEPVEEMQKAFDRLAQQAPKAARGDAGAKNDMNNKSIPEIKKAWEKLDNATNNSRIKPIDNVNEAISNVMNTVDAGDQEKFAPTAKDLVAKVNDLSGIVNQLPGPNKKKMEKLNDEIAPLMKDFLQRARDAVKNPDDSDAVDQANAAADRMRVPLAAMKKLMDEDAHDREVEQLGAEVKKAMADVRDAIKSGDKEKTRDALGKLKDALARYNRKADDVTDNHPNPHKRRALEKAVGDLKDQLLDVRNAQNRPDDTGRVKEVLDGVGDAVDNFISTMRNTDSDDLLKAGAVTNNLFASLGNLNGDDMDLGDLLATADSLSGLLRGLMGDPNSEAARAARNLDDVLARMDKRDPRFSSPASSIGVMPSALDMDVTVENIVPDSKFQKFDVKKATKVEDIMSGVAYEIHEKAKHISGDADQVALALAELGNAARSGNRTELLKASKAAAMHIAALCKKLQELAAKIPGNSPQEKRLKDQLLRAAQGLRDMSTQLKILCAVKAATIEDSRDTDGALSILTRNLGTVMMQGLDAMQIAKVTMKVK